MAEKTIMLACNAGMSTSLLVAKMQKAAADAGEDVEIFATSADQIDQKMDEKNPNILMLGPQVRYMFKKLQDRLDIPVEVIDMKDYGMMNGKAVLETALKGIKE
ncbi:PTS sugar transporter subunit IIB [Lacticaseibacillus pantheris]